MSTPTMFDAEQTWLAPVNYRRTRWPKATGISEDIVAWTPAAMELLGDPVWRRKIERGLADSASGRVQSLRDHLAAG